MPDVTPIYRYSSQEPIARISNVSEDELGIAIDVEAISIWQYWLDRRSRIRREMMRDRLRERRETIEILCFIGLCLIAILPLAWTSMR